VRVVDVTMLVRQAVARVVPQALDVGAQLHFSVGTSKGLNGEYSDAIEVDRLTTYGSVDVKVEWTDRGIDALKEILSSTPRRLDLGNAGENIFLNICGTGIDTQVLHYSERVKKYVRGMTPYIFGILLAIFKHKPYQLRITIDDSLVLEGNFLLCSVANGRYFGGGIPVAPYAEVDDAYLDVILVDHVNKLRIPFYLLGLLNKKILRYKISKFFRAKKIKLESMNGKQLVLNEDGEIFRAKEVTFSVRPKSLKMYW